MATSISANLSAMARAAPGRRTVRASGSIRVRMVKTTARVRAGGAASAARPGARGARRHSRPRGQARAAAGRGGIAPGSRRRSSSPATPGARLRASRRSACHGRAQPGREARDRRVDLGQGAAELLAQAPVGGKAQDGGGERIGDPRPAAAARRNPPAPRFPGGRAAPRRTAWAGRARPRPAMNASTAASSSRLRARRRAELP